MNTLSSPLLSSPLLSAALITATLGGASERALAESIVVPQLFAPNVGQAPEGVRFVASTARSQILALDDGFHYRTAEEGHNVGVTLRFLGADPLELPGGSGGWSGEQRGGVFHYLLGAPEDWRPHVPAYALIRRSRLYSGVDLVLHVRGGSPVYDLLVEDAADVHKIRVRCEGVDALEIDGEGRLVATIGPRTLIQSEPIAYRVSESGARETIPVAFQLFGCDEYGFSLPVDVGRVVIDPTMKYATYLGGAAAEAYSDFGILSGRGASAYHRHGGIDVDAFGTVYVTGKTASFNYPTTSGALDVSFQGNSDAVVSAFSGRLKTFVYSTFLGGSTNDEGRGIAVGEDGTAFVVGYTDSIDFPVMSTQGSPYTSQLAMGEDGGFITAIDASGATVIHSNVVQHAKWNDVALITNEENVAVVVVGEGNDGMMTTSGAHQTMVTSGGGPDYAVLKEDMAGTNLVASTFLGGTNQDIGMGIDVFDDGDVVVCGTTASTVWSAAPFYPIHPPGNKFGHAFFAGSSPNTVTVGGVTRLRDDLSGLVWSGHLGSVGNGTTTMWDVVVGTDGSSYFVGDCTGLDYTTLTTSYQPSKASLPTDTGAVITKVDSTGLGLTYSTYVGGAILDEPSTSAFGVDLWSDGQGVEHAVFCGTTRSAGFPTPGTTWMPQQSLVVMMSADGTGLLSTTTYGSALGVEDAYDIRTSVNGLVAYMLGATDSLFLPIPGGAVQNPPGGGQVDYFVTAFLLP